MRHNIQPVLAFGELERAAVARHEEMIVRRYASLANEQTAAAHELVTFAIHPDIKVSDASRCGKAPRACFQSPAPAWRWQRAASAGTPLGVSAHPANAECPAR